MLKKVIFYTIGLLVGSAELFSQCPVSVEIIADQSGEVCRNTLINFTAQPTNGGTNPSYVWMVNGDTVSTNTTLSSAINGAHIELFMTSSNGCAQPVASASQYIINTEINVSYSVPEPTECNQPKNDVAIHDITGGTAPYSYYLHTNNEDLAQSDYYADLPISSYPLIVTDANSCVDTTWIPLTTKECDPIQPMEVFTPNDDGIFDKWYILNLEDYPKNKVYVFDRWGQRVYYKENYENIDAWDAKYAGANLPVTTFYYVIELEFEKQETQVYKGAVSILR